MTRKRMLVGTIAGILAISGIAIVAVLFALRDSRPAPTAQNRVKIAVCGPMSGSAYFYGSMMWKAAEMVRDEYRAGIDIGTANYEVEFVATDDRNDINLVKTVAAEIAGANEFVAVVGHHNSACTLEAGKIYGDRVLQITPASTNPDVCASSAFTFRTTFVDTLQGAAVAKFFHVRGKKRIVVFFDDDSYGTRLYDEFRDRAREMGIIVKGYSYQRETAHFAENIRHAVRCALNDPPANATSDEIFPDADGVFIAGLHEQAMVILRAVRALDTTMDIPIVGSDGLHSHKFAEAPEAAGVFVTSPYELDAPRVREFEAAFLRRYHTTPDMIAVLTYDACRLLVRTIADSDTLDRAALQQKLAALWTAEHPFDGVTGPIWFDAEGNRADMNVHFYRIADRRFVAAETPIAETAPSTGQ